MALLSRKQDSLYFPIETKEVSPRRLCIPTNKRNVLSNLAANYVAFFTNIVLNLISVPICVSYFGHEKFGVLSLILVFGQYLTLLNLGVPSLLNTFLLKRIDDSTRLHLVHVSTKIQKIT